MALENLFGTNPGTRHAEIDLDDAKYIHTQAISPGYFVICMDKRMVSYQHFFH